MFPGLVLLAMFGHSLNVASGLVCFHCEDVTSLSHCTQVQHCSHHENTCFVEVNEHEGIYTYKMGCRPDHDCHTHAPVIGPIGKRARHGSRVCTACCNTDRCRPTTCSQVHLPTTALQCYYCDGASHLNHCTTVQHCSREQHYCSMEIHHGHGGLTYKMGCQDDWDCTASHLVLPGQKTDGHHGPHDVVCRQCCKHNNCLPHACLTYGVSTVPPPPTPTSPVPVTQDCRDHEEDGFRCADWDKYSFCDDPNGIGYSIAVDKCPRHCGLCGHIPNEAQVTTQKLTTTTTHAPTVKTTDVPPAKTTTDGPIIVDVVGSNGSTAPPCADMEDSSFKCIDFVHLDICTTKTSPLSDLASLRCSKFCGFCG